jgi:hypothetical protein
VDFSCVCPQETRAAAQMMAVMYLFFIDRNYYHGINCKFTELFAVYIAAESIKIIYEDADGGKSHPAG